MNKLLEKVFLKRGYSEDFLQRIHEDDHDLLFDIDNLCQRLYDIRAGGHELVLLPDFDMDGIMSGVLGFAGFAELGFRISLFIPDPEDGYGFDENVIQKLVSDYPNVHTIITADTGITCYDGIRYAKEQSIQVLITDHHRQESDGFLKSQADVIVNPMRIDETYSNPKICGAHVLYQVLLRFAVLYDDAYATEQIHRLRVFAGIGTVSDMMPVFFENRTLIQDAVSICKYVFSESNLAEIGGCDVYRRAFYGLHIALQLYSDAGKISDENSIDEDFFGYYLSPTFNSVKRMNGNMMTAFGVFFGVDPPSDMNTLFTLNEERKRLVAHYMHEIDEQLNPYAPYVYVSDAPAGILGLLATKIIGATGLPVLVVRKDGNGFHGSGRSPEWFPALTEFHREGFWSAGHEGSFGVGITDVRELKSIHAFLSKRVPELMEMLESEEVGLPGDLVIAMDGSGDIGFDIPMFYEYLDELALYRPFGVGFREPMFLLKLRNMDIEWTLLGKMKQHIKLLLPFGLEAIVWNSGHRLSELMEREEVYLLGSFSLNEFRGAVTLNFVGDFVDI